MEVWQLQEAKNKFSELVEHALHDGPQLVTRHGKPAVVVMSAAEYDKTLVKPQEPIDWLLAIPKNNNDEELFVRIDSPMRDIDL